MATLQNLFPISNQSSQPPIGVGSILSRMEVFHWMMNNLSLNRPDDIRHLKIRSFLCCAKIIMLMILFCFCFVIVLAKKYKKNPQIKFCDTITCCSTYMLDVGLCACQFNFRVQGAFVCNSFAWLCSWLCSCNVSKWNPLEGTGVDGWVDGIG